jgi:hypothetical protein
MQKKCYRKPASRLKEIFNMTSPQTESQADVANIAKQNDKDINFRKQEAMFQRQLEQERNEKESLRKELELAKRQPQQQEDDDDSEPYVDHKKLNKKLSSFGQNTQSEIQKAMEIAKQSAKEELKQEMFLENNPDFYHVLEKADELMTRAPKLAENILKMPNNFDRQKLVYQTMKELGVDKPPKEPSTIQGKIDANKRSPYYQPSGVGAAPYAAQSDFSQSGQKNAYEKMQALKNQLRL